VAPVKGIRSTAVTSAPSKTARRTIAQGFMEWDPLVRIYESRLWRRGPLLSLVTGISFDSEYALIAGALQLDTGTRILDLACGTGIYTRRFAQRRPDAVVVGMDLSSPMLRYALRRTRGEQLTNVALVRGDALAFPFGGGFFDGVNCCGALHLFPDVDRVLREIRRVLRDDGRLTIAAFRRGDGAVARARADLRRRLYGVDSFTPGGLRQHLEAAGFAGVRCLHASGIWLIVAAETHAARLP
jgi:SAM-dependent methyltransferase